MSSSSKIFISYRRVDSNVITGRIYDRLVKTYGLSSIFKDVDTIPFGEDFRKHIRTHVEQCQILMVVIGPIWLNITDENGNRRLDDPDDWVRIEISIALDLDIPVIPLYVMGTAPPPSDQLPSVLESMAHRNGIEIRDDPDFHTDMERLIKRLPVAPSSAASILATLPPLSKLSAPQRQQLRSALMKAFPEISIFTLMYEDYFDTPLNQVVNTNAMFAKVVADSIKNAEASGKLLNLLQAALMANPNSLDIKAFVEDLLGLS